MIELRIIDFYERKIYDVFNENEFLKELENIKVTSIYFTRYKVKSTLNIILSFKNYQYEIDSYYLSNGETSYHYNIANDDLYKLTKKYLGEVINELNEEDIVL